jgi:hypothetical protein
MVAVVVVVVVVVEVVVEVVVVVVVEVVMEVVVVVSVVVVAVVVVVVVAGREGGRERRSFRVRAGVGVHGGRWGEGGQRLPGARCVARKAGVATTASRATARVGCVLVWGGAWAGRVGVRRAG